MTKTIKGDYTFYVECTPEEKTLTGVCEVPLDFFSTHRHRNWNGVEVADIERELLDEIIKNQVTDFPAYGAIYDGQIKEHKEEN